MFIPLTQRFFGKELATISTYTLDFGLKLNIEKPMIIPFNTKPLPDWVCKTGCRILKPKEGHKYIGTPLGQDLDSRQLHNFVIKRVKNLIHSWMAKTLSFPGKKYTY